MSDDQKGPRRPLLSVAGEDQRGTAPARDGRVLSTDRADATQRGPQSAATAEDVDQTVQQVRAYFGYTDLWSTP